MKCGQFQSWKDVSSSLKKVGKRKAMEARDFARFVELLRSAKADDVTQHLKEAGKDAALLARLTDAVAASYSEPAWDGFLAALPAIPDSQSLFQRFATSTLYAQPPPNSQLTLQRN